jgi:aryl-alcohol dehydrogenase-like predicted oxidoreductase
VRQQRIGDRTISSVGCGDVRLATATARNVDAREVERAVLTALELGITLIDAAEEEAAERLCGDAVRALRLRDRAVVACRVPELAPRAGAPRRDGLPERLPPAHVQQRIEASLRATRLDALPLAQLPLRAAWRASPLWPELVGACARLVREGKVLAWGAICGGGAEGEAADAAELAAEPWLASISIPYSLCERGAEAVLAVASGGGATALASAAEPERSESGGAASGGAASSGAAVPNAARSGGGGLLVIDDAELALLGGGADLDLLVKASAELGLLGGPAGSSAGVGTGAGAEPAGSGAALVTAGPKAILARRPLAGGALAGSLGPGARLAIHDDRRSLDEAALERIAVFAAKLAPLVKREPPAARSCEAALTALERGRRPPDVEAATLAEFALRFVLDRGAIALPRLHRAEHVAEAIAAAAAPPLSQALLERLADLST